MSTEEDKKFVYKAPPHHSGNLTDEEKEALQSLTDSIPEKYAATTDEYELLRFLRARKFVVADALEMFTEYKRWYTEENIANILEKPIDNIELVVKLIPNAYFGYDKKGYPIYIERTGSIDPEVLMSVFSHHEILYSHIWGQEYKIRRCNEFCKNNDLPVGIIDKLSTIMDLEGLGLHHMDCMKFTKLISEHDNKYYPERMGNLFIVNPTMTFKIFWNLAKLWLDAQTKEKIIVCNDLAQLLEYIDADQLPKRYGGNCDVEGLEDPDIPAIREDLKNNNPFEKFYKTLPVAAGKDHTITVQLEAGQNITWSFKTSHAMIFACHFYTENQTIPDVPPEESVDATVINNKGSLNSHDLPQRGYFKTDKKGTLVFYWHNNSWWGTKDLHYYIDALKDEVKSE